MSAHASTGRLLPGATIGILGGGQLGRMLALAAARLGLRSHVFCPDADSPAAQVTARATLAAYGDEAALAAFAGAVDVVTYEFENIPLETVGFLAERVMVRPGTKALATTQDRLAEKRFLNGLGIATAAFAVVDDPAGLRAALAELPPRAVLKARRFGYDGKAQGLIDSPEEAEAAWRAVGGAPAILEAFVPFAREVSVLIARGADGARACYDVTENTHRHHILHRSRAPAAITPALAVQAQAMAARIVAALDYVGVMGVEMFVTAEDDLLVNELAPRVHNSGHWTLDACLVSQFEQHVRAIADWPLGAPVRHSDAVMENLLGAEVEDWPRFAAEADTAVHIYGKSETRPGRKMGHLTRLFPRGALAGASPAEAGLADQERLE